MLLKEIIRDACVRSGRSMYQFGTACEAANVCTRETVYRIMREGLDYDPSATIIGGMMNVLGLGVECPGLVKAVLPSVTPMRRPAAKPRSRKRRTARKRAAGVA